MRSNTSFAIATALLIALMVTAPDVRAGVAGAGAGSALVPAVSGGLSPRPDAAGAVPVQSRSCRACRRDCYVDYRINCGYSERCRGAFTRCMRMCWEAICR